MNLFETKRGDFAQLWEGAIKEREKKVKKMVWGGDRTAGHTDETCSLGRGVCESRGRRA